MRSTTDEDADGARCPGLERLHKVLAHRGVASLRAAERMIEAGRVRVNGAVVRRLGQRVDPEHDAIVVDGHPLPERPSEHIYLMLNKPRGYLTTLADPRGRPTILDLLGSIERRVYPVGRLDCDSEGLLLLTDDGQLARGLMHPTGKVPKTYRVVVLGCPEAADLHRLARGEIVLDGRPALPARARIVRLAPDQSTLEITVSEGRKHQVRRMLDAVGHRVLHLRRIGYGGLALGRLELARFRRLRPAEVERLRQAVRCAPRRA